MKVFTVYIDEYDYQNVIGVFSSKEKAEKVARLIECGAIDGPFELDDFTIPEIPTDKTFFRVRLDVFSNATIIPYETAPLDYNGNVQKEDKKGHFYGTIFRINLWAADEDDAIKLAKEKYNEYVAHKEKFE